MVPNFVIDITRIASLLRMVEHMKENTIKFPFIIHYSLTLVNEFTFCYPMIFPGVCVPSIVSRHIATST